MRSQSIALLLGATIAGCSPPETHLAPPHELVSEVVALAHSIPRPLEFIPPTERPFIRLHVLWVSSVSNRALEEITTNDALGAWRMAYISSNRLMDAHPKLLESATDIVAFDIAMTSATTAVVHTRRDMPQYDCGNAVSYFFAMTGASWRVSATQREPGYGRK
jgi:hypothetical protein